MQVRRRAPLRRPGLFFAVALVVVLVLDQLTKVIVRAIWSSPASANPLDRLISPAIPRTLMPGESMHLIGGWLQLSFVRNQGAAFGLLPGQRMLFILTSMLVIALLGLYWWREKPRGRFVVLGLSMAAAGAIGNLIDRVVIGHVTDFIDVAVIDFPVFNVADASISVGVAILILWLLFASDDSGAGEAAPAEEEA